jgi:hypothetical protein
MSASTVGNVVSVEASPAFAYLPQLTRIASLLSFRNLEAKPIEGTFEVLCARVLWCARRLTALHEDH